MSLLIYSMGEIDSESCRKWDKPGLAVDVSALAENVSERNGFMSGWTLVPDFNLSYLERKEC
ncbi:hypothetical protein F2Q70_00017092 [Brassica cretica]|uniref:Uncharacterized protein n=1 Tax=Brassica cretica TaxID=69181 RepID=A0A3N6SU25_BRACR|nr:hypothetical protein F2Q70_00017092 [Brassica cretica]KAF2599049.1 hypothetical protein F2Q68_00010045 [Brassica cretica]KAF3541039.1 hypothetical protein F2Q69_00021990 [Brassica cretica]